MLMAVQGNYNFQEWKSVMQVERNTFTTIAEDGPERQ